MQKKYIGLNTKAQTAIEYMLLLGAVVSIVLIGFKTYLPSFQVTSNYYFNQIGIGVLGNTNRCGDGVCNIGGNPPNPIENCEKCPVDCGACLGCGDTWCIGDEDCVSCATDCGVCT